MDDFIAWGARELNANRRDNDRRQARLILLRRGWQPALIDSYLTFPANVHETLASDDQPPCENLGEMTFAQGDRPSSPPAEPDWPPDAGWHFRNGQYAYGGATFDLTGSLWHILKKLATSNRRFTWEEIRDASRGEDSPTGKKAIGSHLSSLRAILRRHLGLAENVDPIPSKGRGDDLVYWLDVSNVKQPRNGSKAKKSSIEPKLSPGKARR